MFLLEKIENADYSRLRKDFESRLHEMCVRRIERKRSQVMEAVYGDIVTEEELKEMLGVAATAMRKKKKKMKEEDEEEDSLVERIIKRVVRGGKMRRKLKARKKGYTIVHTKAGAKEVRVSPLTALHKKKKLRRSWRPGSSRRTHMFRTMRKRRKSLKRRKAYGLKAGKF